MIRYISTRDGGYIAPGSASVAEEGSFTVLCPTEWDGAELILLPEKSAHKSVRTQIALGAARIEAKDMSDGLYLPHLVQNGHDRPLQPLTADSGCLRAEAVDYAVLCADLLRRVIQLEQRTVQTQKVVSEEVTARMTADAALLRGIQALRNGITDQFIEF